MPNFSSWLPSEGPEKGWGGRTWGGVQSRAGALREGSGQAQWACGDREG